VGTAPAGIFYALATGHADTLAEQSVQDGRVEAVFVNAAQQGIALIRAGWKGDCGDLERGASMLAGLGGGLTPAGDDFLVGLMLYSWMAHPSPMPVCQAIYNNAAGRTNMLSRAFLAAASTGECSMVWHDLFRALESGTDRQVDATLQRILSFGSSSGSDALAGFLWMALSRC
jgi:hypothetical protein